VEAGCHPHDAVVAASLVAPTLFTFEPARLRVLTDGEHLGRIERIEGEPNAELCVSVDARPSRPCCWPGCSARRR
jgi:purine nucleosidase